LYNNELEKNIERLIELNQTQQNEDERFGYLAWGIQENG